MRMTGEGLQVGRRSTDHEDAPAEPKAGRRREDTEQAKAADPTVTRRHDDHENATTNERV